ncbi:MAG TPA: hypothetical protein VFJ16_29585 [Longimicrobium sp.]|nr:hypothetical protein [Longimicrobium sp.]
MMPIPRPAMLCLVLLAAVRMAALAQPSLELHERRAAERAEIGREPPCCRPPTVRTGTQEERRQIQLAVMRAVLRDQYRDPLAATCISLGSHRVAPDSAFLAALQGPGRGPVLPPGRCPPTYEIGERVGPNPPPRPPGARDPYLTRIESVIPLRAGRARVKVREDHGSEIRGYTCTASRRAGAWSADCRLTYMAVA